MSLDDVIREFSPFGDEAVICAVNDVAYKSVDANDATIKPGDDVKFYPLVIGG